MIHLVIGNQGSTKTLFMVKIAYEYHLNGYKIFSNVHLNFPYTKLNYDDIINCRLQGDKGEKAMVLIDELHLLLPSRNSMCKRSRLIVNSFLSQARKRGLEIWGSTQRIRKCDISFREETDMLYTCEKFAYINNEWEQVFHNQDLKKSVPITSKISVTQTYDGQTLEFSFLANDYFDLYDTTQIIEITE